VELDLGRRSFAARVVVVLAVVAALAAAPGRASASMRSSGTPEGVWIDNAVILITQLDQDVLTSSTGGADLATANVVLDNPSDQIALLIANVDFGGCGESVRNLGEPTSRLRQVARELAAACTILERASTLFTRAATRSDPRPLLASARLSRRASLLLRSATGELEALRRALRI
jgi:hypothetical protein